MMAFSFIDNSPTLWGKYRLPALRNLSLACMIFISSCILASISWKLGASSIFVFLYILLGLTGFLISSFSISKETLEKRAEMLPLITPSCYKRIIEERETTKIGDFLKADARKESQIERARLEPNARILTTDNSEIKRGVEGNKTFVKCFESCYLPVHEVYVTGPSPGGGNSKTDGEDSEIRKDGKLSPILNVFRSSTVERSAQFHVPLPESSGELLAERTPDSELLAREQPEAEARWISSDPREPLYHNIIPYPERRRLSFESDLINFLEYDLPKEPRRVSGEEAEMPPECDRNVSSSVPEGGLGTGQDPRNESMFSLGAFTSPQRTYVNFCPSIQRKKDPKNSSPPPWTVIPPASLPECRSETDTLTNLRSCPLPISDNIYANVPRGHKEDHTPDSPRIRSPKHIKSDKKGNSVLQQENIYMNVSSLITKNLSHESDASQDSPQKSEKCSMSSKSSVSSGSIHEKLADANLSQADLKFESTETSGERQYQNTALEEENSDNKEIDIELFRGISDGNSFLSSRSPIERIETKKARSDCMFVTGLGPNLKTCLKPSESATQNINSKPEINPSMKLGDRVTDESSPCTEPSETPESMKNESTEVKREYENLTYGESFDTSIGKSESTFLIQEKEESLTTMDNLTFTKLPTNEKEENIQATNSTQKSGLNETFSVDPKVSSSCSNLSPGKSRRNQLLQEIPDHQVIPSKSASAITEVDDSFCALRNLKNGETCEAKLSQHKLIDLENSKDAKNFSVSLSKHPRTLSQEKTEANLSKVLEGIFTPKKQSPPGESSVSATGTEEVSFKRGSFNSPLQISRVRSYRSPEARAAMLTSPPTVKVPLICPPLDSLGSPPYPQKVDLPVICNSSSYVQAQLEKFEAFIQSSAEQMKMPIQSPFKSSIPSQQILKSTSPKSPDANLPFVPKSQSPQRDFTVTSSVISPTINSPERSSDQYYVQSVNKPLGSPVQSPFKLNLKPVPDSKSLQSPKRDLYNRFSIISPSKEKLLPKPLESSPDINLNRDFVQADQRPVHSPVKSLDYSKQNPVSIPEPKSHGSPGSNMPSSTSLPSGHMKELFVSSSTNERLSTKCLEQSSDIYTRRSETKSTNNAEPNTSEALILQNPQEFPVTQSKSANEPSEEKPTRQKHSPAYF